MDVVEDGAAQQDTIGERTPTQLIFGQGTLHCKVMVNGEHICTSHGWNQLEVETAAAEEAVEILRKRGVFAASNTGTALEGAEEVEQRDLVVEELAAVADDSMDLDEPEDQGADMQEDGGVRLISHESHAHKTDEPGHGSGSSTEGIIFSGRKRRRAHSDHDV